MLSQRIARFIGVIGMATFAVTAAQGERSFRATADRPTAAEDDSPEPIGDAWSDPRNPIVAIFGGERLDLWSLQPVRRPVPPPVERADWGRNPIDRFVLARLEQAGLEPTAEADARVLVRRVYFDLIGLPPPPDTVSRFLKDERPDAYERLVDELLASPRYGEHIARMWLDVVRYSDSNGFDWDEFRPQAWRYRDYVIRSFNADKPYDAFIREQLAGDELAEGPPQSAADRDRLLATGFLRIGPQDNSASLFNEQDRARAEWMFDLVETTGSAFLGLTFSCCRCHDHKHDPLSQADYYRMQAFFEPLRYADDTPLDLADEQHAIKQHNAALDEQVQLLEEERSQLRDPAQKRLTDQKIAELSESQRQLLGTDPDELSEDEKANREQLEQRIAVSDEEVTGALSEDDQQRDKQLAEEIEAVRRSYRQYTYGLLATDAADDPPPTHILDQGNHTAKGAIVPPGFPSVIDPNPAEISRGANPQTHGRRLALANWIASPDNPLTARVLVNRVWQMHFGRGLVETPNDFGLAGARPSHPELLDWLAADFVQNGWSLKHLQRRIVTSATYRQATSRPPAEDAQNALLSRQNLRRLTGEQLRDALLAVSGLLTQKSGGSPVWPELPPEILQANPAFLDDNAEKTKGWYPSPAEEQAARSIFLVQKRGVQVPFLVVFDLPGNSVSCPRRTSSTVAPQALSLLNSPLAIEAAEALACRVRQEAGGDAAAQVTCVFSLALQRPPQDDERAKCLTFLMSQSLEELCRVVLNLNEFVYVE